ncbi:MAG: transcriptional repressor [Paludibacter sp.]|nr:transcriptional repressor [Bacteroidales bacterium]MCM1068672.1 transcriptional repressor [Prevotella sp.]MCM1353336.1 transcriptional repressor [Bacteroides sp.]MCM1442256.1 transcriptional repressor [Muribaculum sp.]MCM1481075.1 transcriptional repressor [Paludibacter sp.]
MKSSVRQQEQHIQTLYEDAAVRLREYLKDNGLRCTPERLFLLKQICSYKRNFTAELLIKDMQSVVRVSTGTVYNTLDLLCACHIIRKLSLQHKVRVVEYELLRGNAHTMRFVCTNCGRMVDFKDKAIENILKGKRFSNFVMNDFSLSVYGTCKICRRKTKQ